MKLAAAALGGLLLATGAMAASPFDGLWAPRADECKAVFLLLRPNGEFEHRLGDEPRKGRFSANAERITLRFEDGEDQVLPVMDRTESRLVLFDETVEGDRRLVRCP